MLSKDSGRPVVMLVLVWAHFRQTFRQGIGQGYSQLGDFHLYIDQDMAVVTKRTNILCQLGP